MENLGGYSIFEGTLEAAKPFWHILLRKCMSVLWHDCAMDGTCKVFTHVQEGLQNCSTCSRGAV